MWASRWSAAIRIRRSLVPEDRVRGAVPGPVQRLAGCGRGSAISSPSASGLVTSTWEPQPRKLRETLCRAAVDLLGDAAAQHQLDREAVLGLGVLVEVGEALGGDADRGDLGAGVLDDDLDQAEVVDVLVGDDHQLEVVDRVAALAELALQLVERLAGVGPGVDQGQRLVLDQVAVDPADRERGRDREAVDSGQRRLLERRLGGQLAHARISRQDLVALRFHVLAGDQRLEVEPQQRLGVGGADVEVPVGVVDRDPVEVGELGPSRVALLDLRHLRLRVVDLGVDLAGDEVPGAELVHQLGRGCGRRARAAPASAAPGSSPSRRSRSRGSSSGRRPRRRRPRPPRASAP